jgi:hypothetical protein
MAARRRAVEFLAALCLLLPLASGGVANLRPESLATCVIAESPSDVALPAAELVYADFNPLVVSVRFPVTVEIRVRTDGSIDAAEIELAAGGTLPLAPSGREFYVDSDPRPGPPWLRGR